RVQQRVSWHLLHECQRDPGRSLLFLQQWRSRRNKEHVHPKMEMSGRVDLSKYFQNHKRSQEFHRTKKYSLNEKYTFSDRVKSHKNLLERRLNSRLFLNASDLQRASHEDVKIQSDLFHGEDLKNWALL